MNSNSSIEHLPVGGLGPVSPYSTTHAWLPVSGVGHIFTSLTAPTDGQTRGTLVVCPALGREHFFSHRAAKYLAELAAQTGIAVLRVDYPGTGDSTGESLEHSPSDWVAAMHIAIDSLYSWGAPTVSLLGIRAGALIADQVISERTDIHALYLWEPVGSGRQYVRASHSFVQISTGYEPISGIGAAIEDMALSDTATAELKKIRLRSSIADNNGASIPTLIVGAREQREKQVDALAEAPGVTRIETPGGRGFYSPPHFVSAFPTVAIKVLATHIERDFPDDTQTLVPKTAQEVEFQLPGSEIVLRERAEYVGPNKLFQITTQLADDTTSPDTAIVFNSLANAPHYGPSRTAVDWARRSAARGCVSVRWDRRQCGETSPGQDDELATLYGSSSIDDALYITRNLPTSPEKQIVVGLCSGGWIGAQQVLDNPSRHLVFISPTIWDTDRPVINRELLVRNGWNLTTGDSPPRPTTGWKGRVLFALFRNCPYPLWWIVARTGLVELPSRLLLKLAKNQVPTTFIFDDADWKLFGYSHGHRGLRRASSFRWAPRIVHFHGDASDHALVSPAYLEQAWSQIDSTIEAVRQAGTPN